MPVINVLVDDVTEERLRKAALRASLSREEICESLVSEGMLDWARKVDPDFGAIRREKDHG